MRKNKLVIGMMILICIALTTGIIALNKLNKDSATFDNMEDKNKDIEKGEVIIPAIKEKEVVENPPDEDLDNDVESENIEGKGDTAENIDNKININPISKPDKEKLPEAMEKPVTEPEPTEQPKPINEEVKDKSKPPTSREEPKEIKGGTDSNGVIRDLKGNPTGLKPAENVEEIKGSDLLPDGKKAGEGDKF